MESLALFFSSSGRLAPKPFARAVVAVYAAAFLSQFLISPPLLRIGLAAFALVQAISMWAWFCLHAKRLRDAERPIGLAVAIVVLYALAMILLLLVIALVLGMTPGGDGTDVLISSHLVRIIAGDPDPGFFGYVAAGVLLLVFAPMLIAMWFSIWIGAMPPAAAASPQP